MTPPSPCDVDTEFKRSKFKMEDDKNDNGEDEGESVDSGGLILPPHRTLCWFFFSLREDPNICAIAWGCSSTPMTRSVVKHSVLVAESIFCQYKVSLLHELNSLWFSCFSSSIHVFLSPHLWRFSHTVTTGPKHRRWKHLYTSLQRFTVSPAFALHTRTSSLRTRRSITWLSFCRAQMLCDFGTLCVRFLPLHTN
jgi:hypothetical protein